MSGSFPGRAAAGDARSGGSAQRARLVAEGGRGAGRGDNYPRTEVLKKGGGVLVNTLRGKVVDEEAMIRVLEDGHCLVVVLSSKEANPRRVPGWIKTVPAGDWEYGS